MAHGGWLPQALQKNFYYWNRIKIDKTGLNDPCLGACIATPVQFMGQRRVWGIQNFPKEDGKTNNSK